MDSLSRRVDTSAILSESQQHRNGALVLGWLVKVPQQTFPFAFLQPCRKGFGLGVGKFNQPGGGAIFGPSAARLND
jgi:hypothetical protein